MEWKIIQAIAASRLRVDDLVTYAFSLENFAEALDTFVGRKDEAVKVVIESNGPEEAKGELI